MKSILGYIQGSPFRIDTEFLDAQGKPYTNTTLVKNKKDVQEEVPVYSNRDTVKGQVKITPMTTKKLEHMGIKVQLLGLIDVTSERGVKHEFMGMARGLAGSGELSSPVTLPFEFPNVEMQYDSYKGQQVRCRYLLRVNIAGKGITPDTKQDTTLCVCNFEQPSEAVAPIKMEVGIEDCLHIEFEYDRARYHLKDVVVGKIYFLLVRIKLKHMEVEIRRKETVGGGSNVHSEVDTLAKYEIMDGAPVRGECVPIRLYLSPYDLSPTYKDVHNKYSVRYFLNLVLVDEEDRRYFKQQEITLFRKKLDTPAEAAAAAAAGPPKLAHYPDHYNNGAPRDASRMTSTSSSSSSATAGVAISKGAGPSASANSTYHAPSPYNSTDGATSAAPAPAPAASKSAESTSGGGVQGMRDMSNGGLGGGVNGSADGPLSVPAPQQPGQLKLPQLKSSNPLEPEAPLPSSWPSPPPLFERYVPPPAADTAAHPAAAAAVPPHPVSVPAPQPTPVPATLDAPQTVPAPPLGSHDSSSTQGVGIDANVGAAAPEAQEDSELSAPGAAAAAAATAAGGMVDPMLGGGGGDVGDDLEPLSFGDIEEGKE